MQTALSGTTGDQEEYGGRDGSDGAPDRALADLVRGSLARLIAYCEKNDWAGFDPYDALNSRVFAALPLSRVKLCRLIFTQFMKRCPVNIRQLLLIAPRQNPKAHALFSMALLRLRAAEYAIKDSTIASLAEDLLRSRSPGEHEHCWGYHFDWQGRYVLTPRFSPNIICTTFAANGLLDVYEAFGLPEHRKAAVSAGWFILGGLNIYRNERGICFSYTPHDRARVHNANLLAAALLARLAALTGEAAFAEHAADAVRYSVARQNRNGSWFYGEHATQRWIDNFHTGYNLVALSSYSRYAGTSQYEDSIQRGYRYYREHFFTSGALPKYFSERTYPIDIHCIAQSIITLTSVAPVDAAGRDLLRAMLRWVCGSMQSRRGYFFYQKGRFMTNRIPYMRWSQAWMLYALAHVAASPHREQRHNPGPRSESAAA